MKIEILYKYLNEEASEAEVQELFDWIEASPKNKAEFISLKKAWSLSASSASDQSESLKFLQNELFPKQKYKYTWLKYAAILAIFIGIALLYSPENPGENDDNSIVLETTSGFKTKITDDSSQLIEDQHGVQIAKKGDNEIIYNAGPKGGEKVDVYNTLTVPFGKTFNITLSDGTRVKLNAGTSLTYPEHFAKTGARQVTLIGEAHFEVTRKTEQPFIVHTEDYQVEVLGTIFNVNTYHNDNSSHIVLVSGAVKLRSNENASISTTLKPNDKAVWIHEAQRFDVQTIDSSIYTAWTRGDLAFDNASFEFITKKLERSFNVSIQNNNTDLSQQTFSGTLKIKNSNIQTILDLLKLDTPFIYEINENRIVIRENPDKR